MRLGVARGVLGGWCAAFAPVASARMTGCGAGCVALGVPGAVATRAAGARVGGVAVGGAVALAGAGMGGGGAAAAEAGGDRRGLEAVGKRRRRGEGIGGGSGSRSTSGSGSGGGGDGGADGVGGGDGVFGGVSRAVRLETGAVAIPHPDKVAKGGEDAFFAAGDAAGVFDGVGGWASIGVDPGLYSKQLAATTARMIRERGPDKALDALTAAVEDTSAVGSSTACVVGLVQPGGVGGEDASSVAAAAAAKAPSRTSSMTSEDSAGAGAVDWNSVDAGAEREGGERVEDRDVDVNLDVNLDADDGGGEEAEREEGGEAHETAPAPGPARLLGVNLGDSGLLVIRDGVIVFATKEQQHYFNCPVQLGNGVGQESMDTTQMGDVIDVAVRPGDLAILSSDGVLDNLFPHEILATVADHTPPPPPQASLFPRPPPSRPDPQALAQALADYALAVAGDDRRQTPFAVNAQDAGHIYRGGKMDDITCVVALVVAVAAPRRAPGDAAALPTSPVTPLRSPPPPADPPR